MPKKQIMQADKLFIIILLLVILTQLSAGSSTKIILTNRTNISRTEVIRFNIDSLKSVYPGIVSSDLVVMEGETAVPFEIDTSAGSNYISFYIHFNPLEQKTLMLTKGEYVKNHKKMTRAYLGEKTEYTRSEGYYVGGNFKEVNSTTVPEDHFAHNALYQFEGPGWESELIGYRLYLDKRNRTDIFGKRKRSLLLENVGRNDLVSDGKESYQKLQDWGMDIFKVGSSLGIGSPAIFFSDTVFTISNAERVSCSTFNGSLLSSVMIKHYGCKILDSMYDITAEYSISADDRKTRADITMSRTAYFCTGLAKHSNTELLKSDIKGQWNYIALWGNQTTNNDSLGIALFYDSTSFSRIDEDELNYLVIFEPENNFTYYFAAAWQQEENGFTRNSFLEYLDAELQKLNSPVSVDFR